MALYTVSQVAQMAGISIRALHHYDRIGLLKPASVGENGYRFYGRDELLRLQQILFHRELEFPLEAIAAVLNQPGFDRIGALRRHRTILAAQARRYRQLLKTLDATLADLEGDREMDDKALYKGFSPEKQAEYEAWLIARYGQAVGQEITDAWMKSTAEVKTQADADAIHAKLQSLERAFAAAMAAGTPASSEAAQALVAQHHAFIGRFWSPGREGYEGLAQLYLDHPDFTARYEAVSPGLTEYLTTAMRIYAARNLT